ncbi:MAG: RusA family crossover junction endodeoxyribonuclease [Aliifodinibius sp.]|nr:RusA family crossover junction endodeoxyribonuclease [candidate division Zixibacteria bacterium]NIT58490.1 RusA family crossover junction endodeoxyribonuclease [Fodinibius sp.]NIW46205.1 RusA family crossover junction endodeoxyribonuclease [Gammaproteobacteria bacterium]NIR65172.1 RusA family crossover junction endodeoxyribonuclease [candidate division Zixibacteria bacterium]NIS46904.1 RusA family crossover junction endodeoxyribonuclease [candidate division Zixibacteria bacterium]
MGVGFNPIVLPGNPIPKQRPRLSRYGKAYDPQCKEKKDTQLQLYNQWQCGVLKCAIGIDFKFVFHPPKSWSKKRKAACCEYSHTIPCDVDNLVKFYMDCMNGIVFHDDRQVIDITATKTYAMGDGNTKICLRVFDDE